MTTAYMPGRLSCGPVAPSGPAGAGVHMPAPALTAALPECDCPACLVLSAALDAHADALARGMGDRTRGAVALAARRVDVAHGLTARPW
jgi:hypothetical protein